MNLALGLVTCALVTYTMRALPLLLMRGDIKSRWVTDFLDYVPWAVLTAMVIPAVFSATTNLWSAVAGFAVAVGIALWGRSLSVVALGAALVVWLVEIAL
ncbi:MAG: AzlD domain-containing protein [Actinomycetaceae bacterium]|nr:AzlD domain-containing protein [Actinomycetaceae bacterium]